MPLQQFLSVFQSAFQEGSLLKCTLSKTTSAAPADLKNIYLRPVSLKKGLFVAFNFRYATRDEVKNFPLEAAVEQLTQMMGQAFLHADLLTTERDYHLKYTRSGEAVFSSQKAAHTAPAETAHDREKQRLLDPAAPWLHTLGITSAKGEVLANAGDKWRQVNKYLEIIDSLLRANPLPRDPNIADMGSGKGYLTFALYDFLVQQGYTPRITGIELRPKLVSFCNKAAEQAGFSGLQFMSTDIADYRPERLDMLIALHACDTATDLALAAGIHNKAKIIVAAPCCHKQIRRDMHAQNELTPVLRHGILEERQAEIVTDGIRALLLEAEGYKTSVFEFVSTEHTAKNVMITAIGGKRRDDRGRKTALEKVDALKKGFGIHEHFLEKLLEQPV